jgi:hypothetical protein
MLPEVCTYRMLALKLRNFERLNISRTPGDAPLVCCSFLGKRQVPIYLVKPEQYGILYMWQKVQAHLLNLSE